MPVSQGVLLLGLFSQVQDPWMTCVGKNLCKSIENRHSGHEHWWGSPIPQLYGIRLPNLRCYLHWQNFHQPSKDGILVWSEPGSEITIAPVKILAIPPSFPSETTTHHAPSTPSEPRMIATSKELRFFTSDWMVFMGCFFFLEKDMDVTFEPEDDDKWRSRSWIWMWI